MNELEIKLLFTSFYLLEKNINEHGFIEYEIDRLKTLRNKLNLLIETLKDEMEND